ncbi:MAG: hypothetical protein MI923_08425, partial [Phycisphaerales bacterium]|nr:hypothetical protein [Phycisphaerales bacterium]
LELQKQAMDCGDGELPGFFEFLMRDEPVADGPEAPAANAGGNPPVADRPAVNTSTPDEESR